LVDDVISAAVWMRVRFPSNHLEKRQQRASLVQKKQACRKRKKSRAASPALKIVSTLNFPENLDLILIDGATLLVRARAPPETWTTRPQPCGQPEAALVDHLFRLVIIFSNDCSKFEQSAK
jgi:hypothetical protein